MSNRQLEERHEREINKKIANELGISIDQYEQLVTRLEEIETNDGITTGYEIYFEEGSDPHILKLISGARIGDCIRLGPIDFSTQEE